MTTNFSYGHSHIFWDFIFRSIEDSDELDDNEKVITIISPWLRDISVGSSNIPAEDLRDYLGGYRGQLSKLSDVLIAMKNELGFQINILTLDSTDTVLPKSERTWLDLEATMIEKLVGLDRDNPNINVMKQLGVHAKMYVFPSGALTGSVNLTNAGLFLNGENLTRTDRDLDHQGYRQICINAQAQLQGAVSYYSGFRVDNLVHLIPEDELSERPLSGLEHGKSNFPDPSKNAEAYIIPPKFMLGDIQNTGSHIISEDEQFELHKWCFWFEKEMRNVVKQYYFEFAKRMNQWLETEHEADDLCQVWHKLLIVKQNGESLHDSAIKTFKRSSWDESDFLPGSFPDISKFSPDEALIYGTVINDLWTCIYGSENKPFSDHSQPEGVNLLDKSLYFFTTQVLGLIPKQTDDEKVKKFWYKLEDYFWAIAWVRNRHGHINGIPRKRAIECQAALMKFNNRVLKPFSQYMMR